MIKIFQNFLKNVKMRRKRYMKKSTPRQTIIKSLIIKDKKKISKGTKEMRRIFRNENKNNKLQNNPNQKKVLKGKNKIKQEI